METTTPDNQMLNLGPLEGNEKLCSDNESGPSSTQQSTPNSKIPFKVTDEKILPDLYYGELDKCGLTWRFICIILLYLYIASDIAMQIYFGYVNGCSIADDALVFLYASAILIHYCVSKKMNVRTNVKARMITAQEAGEMGCRMWKSDASSNMSCKKFMNNY